MPFVKLLFEGIKLSWFPFTYNKELYRYTLLNSNEIELIKKYLNEKEIEKDFPKAICFSKAFLSFSEKREIADVFVNKIKEEQNENLKILFFILKNDNNQIQDPIFSTYIDIQNFSRHNYEEEVLFLPFSSFKVIDIKESLFNNINIYEFHLSYLGVFEKYLQILMWKKLYQIHYSMIT